MKTDTLVTKEDINKLHLATKRYTRRIIWWWAGLLTVQAVLIILMALKAMGRL